MSGTTKAFTPKGEARRDALIAGLVFHEPLSLVQIGGIVLVVAGVTMLELGGKH